MQTLSFDGIFPVLTYSPQTDALAVPAEFWDKSGLAHFHAPFSDRLSKSLQNCGLAPGAPFLFPFDFPLLKSVDCKAENGAAEKTAPKSSADGSRWITVHPNGEEGRGVPIRIKANNDGSWSVAGGAGGKLNGLRLTDVKSSEEYKEKAKLKAAETKEKKAQGREEHWSGLKDKHREAIVAEAKERGKSVGQASRFRRVTAV